MAGCFKIVLIFTLPSFVESKELCADRHLDSQAVFFVFFELNVIIYSKSCL